MSTNPKDLDLPKTMITISPSKASFDRAFFDDLCNYTTDHNLPVTMIISSNTTDILTMSHDLLEDVIIHPNSSEICAKVLTTPENQTSEDTQ